jgi:hypothetical protein
MLRSKKGKQELKPAKKKAPQTPTPTQSRHEQQCSVCKHSQREEIETDYTNWKSPDDIATAFGLSRDAIFRHVNALPHLKSKRSRNIRAALEVIIEKGAKVEVTSAAVVAAVQAYTKINDQGKWVDKHEHTGSIFTHDMTKEELERYASTGELPARIAAQMAATGAAGQEARNDG